MMDVVLSLIPEGVYVARKRKLEKASRSKVIPVHRKKSRYCMTCAESADTKYA